jgi:hypothetical protein
MVSKNLDILNKIMHFFRKEVRAHDISLDSNKWDVFSSSLAEGFILWEFMYNEPQEIMGFSKETKVANCVVKFFPNIKNKRGLVFQARMPEVIFSGGYFMGSEEIALIFFKMNRPLTLRDLTNSNKLVHALNAWLLGDNYEKTLKIGKQLDSLQSSLPADVLIPPSYTLYRCIKVEQKAFEKAKKGKVLTLKNRKYSSWTYDLYAAKKFGTTHSRSESEVLVILRKKFSKSEILLDVSKAAKLVPFYSSLPQELIKDEKEIIVRSAIKDIKLKPENIYLYKELSDLPAWKTSWLKFQRKKE